MYEYLLRQPILPPVAAALVQPPTASPPRRGAQTWRSLFLVFFTLDKLPVCLHRLHPRAATAGFGLDGTHEQSALGPSRMQVGQAGDNLSARQQQLAELESQFKTETEALATDPLTEKLESLSLKPTRSNIAVKLVALAWVPHWRVPDGTVLPAWT